MALVMRLVLALVNHDRGASSAPTVPVTTPLQMQGSFSLAFDQSFDIGNQP